MRFSRNNDAASLQLHLQDLLGTMTNAAHMSSDGIASILRPGIWRFAFKYEMLTYDIPPACRQLFYRRLIP